MLKLGIYKLLMESIEDLIHKIVQSPIFKQQLQKQLRKQTQPSYGYQPQSSTYQTLPQIIEEISKYVSEIAQVALQQQNSKNYITFMRKNQQFCLQFEKKINKKVEGSLEQLKIKIQNININLMQSIKSINKKGSDNYKFNQQRKLITRNLIEKSRIQNSSKTQSTIQSIISQNTSCQQFAQIQNNSVINRAWKYQKGQLESQLRKLREIWQQKTKVMFNNIKKDYEDFKTKCSEDMQRCQGKIQSNLESIWNVISDLCSRISKFQSSQQYYEQN